MEIDRLHVVQDLFGDKSSRGFLVFFQERFNPWFIFISLGTACYCLNHVQHANEEFFIFNATQVRVGWLIKDHKMESVQRQQRLLMIPHGHSSTFVSFFCPCNSLIISSTIHNHVHIERTLSFKKKLLSRLPLYFNESLHEIWFHVAIRENKYLII